MKIIYSQLQKLLPKLNKVDPKQVANRLSWLGHFTSSLQTINTDSVIDLEIRQNRGDCLGYLGIAKDLSPLYGPIKLPKYQTITDTNLPQTPIVINSKDVLRIQALTISDIKNIPSPSWLKSFLKNHDINSINCLVDLSNYIMLFYGIPCHAFDADKVKNGLTWQNNYNFNSFTTLDGTKLKLQPDNLIITSQNRVVSLGFIGGQNSGVNLHTKNTIIEMAIYNHSRLRSDSRQLKTITQASTRLDKYLDCNLIPLAFSHLKQLILDLLGGKVSTALLDYYPQPQLAPNIKIDLAQVSRIAGIKIDNNFSIDILTKLGCKIVNNLVTPPSLRKDLTIEEDLVEEVIRFFGYDNIPTNQSLKYKKLTNITPNIIYLIKSLKDDLINLGYNEVRSWPLIKQKHIQKDLLKTNQEVIYTQNSINQEYPVLRHSIISSLQNQAEQYQKYKLDNTSFFEIGKIFYQTNGKYNEKYSLGIYNSNPKKLKKDLKKLKLGKASQTHKNNFGLFVGYILDSKTSDTKTQTYSNIISNAAVELTHQIVTLDANVSFKTKQDPRLLISKYQKKIGDHFWQIKIIDTYGQIASVHGFKYTFRVSYYNISSVKAKKLHLDIFNLN